MSAKIICIEGVDGAGKSTQTQLLTEYLQSLGKSVFFCHFPFYNNISGKGIASYLRGEKDYSLDKAMRLFALNKQEFLESNREIFDYDFIIFDRYTLSNAVCHQAKFITTALRGDQMKCIFEPATVEQVKVNDRMVEAVREASQVLFDSIIHYETVEKNLPLPILTFVLSPSFKRVNQTLAERAENTSRDYLNGKKDINESDEWFILACRELYDSVDGVYNNSVVIREQQGVEVSESIANTQAIIRSHIDKLLDENS